MLAMNPSQTKQAPRPLILISVAPPCSPLQPTTAKTKPPWKLTAALRLPSPHPSLHKHSFQKSKTHPSYHPGP